MTRLWAALLLTIAITATTHARLDLPPILPPLPDSSPSPSQPAACPQDTYILLLILPDGSILRARGAIAEKTPLKPVFRDAHYGTALYNGYYAMKMGLDPNGKRACWPLKCYYKDCVGMFGVPAITDWHAITMSATGLYLAIGQLLQAGNIGTGSLSTIGAATSSELVAYAAALVGTAYVSLNVGCFLYAVQQKLWDWADGTCSPKRTNCKCFSRFDSTGETLYVPGPGSAGPPHGPCNEGDRHLTRYPCVGGGWVNIFYRCRARTTTTISVGAPATFVNTVTWWERENVQWSCRSRRRAG